jgi:hypothetical protein
LPSTAFDTTQAAKTENKTNGAPARSNAFFFGEDDFNDDDDDDGDDDDDANVRFCTSLLMYRIWNNVGDDDATVIAPLFLVLVAWQKYVAMALETLILFLRVC